MFDKQVELQASCPMINRWSSRLYKQTKNKHTNTFKPTDTGLLAFKGL